MKFTALNIGTTQNLEIVSKRISSAVKEFVHNKSLKAKEDNQLFTATDLRQYVQLRVGGYVAPGSPDRILRDLRQKGKINYSLVSRTKSLYRAVPLFNEASIPQADGDNTAVI